MSNNLLNAYNADTFSKQVYEVGKLLGSHLEKCLNGKNDKVITWIEPQDEYKFWADYKFTTLNDFHNDLLNHSIHLHHPKYIGHQVSPPLPITAIESMVMALLNNSTAIYEMGQAASAMERCVVDQMLPFFGYDHSADGIFTSGGTLANLTALLCARGNYQQENIWNDGTKQQYAFLVCEEAHYCIDRAVRIMGWGDEGALHIPSNNHFKMRTELLEEKLIDARKKGIIVLGVVASAPSTSTGMYDDLTSIGKFCQVHNLWYHIDAAHGGPAVFSDKYKHLMAGSALADSITIDGHKMMMMPGLTTMLLFKNKHSSYHTFAQKAQYLFNDGEEEWFNYGKRTIECTKLMMSTRMYLVLKMYGTSLFADNINACFDLAKNFANHLEKDKLFKLAVDPESNIVCFKLKSDKEDENELNLYIRNSILRKGTFYIVQTILKGEVFLRTTIMNPFTTEEDFKTLILEIKEIASSFR